MAPQQLLQIQLDAPLDGSDREGTVTYLALLPSGPPGRGQTEVEGCDYDSWDRGPCESWWRPGTLSGSCSSWRLPVSMEAEMSLWSDWAIAWSVRSSVFVGAPA